MALLQEFLPATLVSRLEGRPSLRDIEPNLFPVDSGPRQGDVVEFHGMEGTGKTETLYHLIIRCIMPVQNGGLEVGVVFVDTDYHFDMLRLVSALEGRLAQDLKESNGSENEPEERVRSCLRRLSVVHCNSSVQLLLTLHYLENTFSSQPSVGLLVIDSISAFYWVDRFSGGESTVCQEANLRKCTELLDRLRRNYGIVVFATTHAIMRNYGSDPGVSDVPCASSLSSSSHRWRSAESATDFDKPYLCRAWQRIVTHRMLFTKSPVSNDHKHVFSTACTSIMTKGVKRSSFHVMEDGIKFICDK
ncbi:DNA repair protein XRCC2 isoform X2 [Pimephales promelas]|uniref:DNA repair protein XRCC2 isoform X2 n=1 Tax=Pimephales promelas TaxID=90988 RepID=UPI0019558E65|nr:DNA repair protein XRCC2 isoform X2 [Pimephales promelas]